jgi:type II secretory pathway pseudopilin PulG
MKLILNIVLALIIIGLVYLLIASIQEPIEFQTEKERRSSVVIDQLREIRQAQQMFRDIKGVFADNFDTLIHVLRTDSFNRIALIGDPDDPTSDAFIRDTTRISAYDSIRAIGMDLDRLPFVPFSDNKQFYVKADTITHQQTLSAVVEVGVKWKEFMGPYADPNYRKYDYRYNPEGVLRFGDMNSPNLSGNWE